MTSQLSIPLPPIAAPRKVPALVRWTPAQVRERFRLCPSELEALTTHPDDCCCETCDPHGMVQSSFNRIGRAL